MHKTLKNNFLPNLTKKTHAFLPINRDTISAILAFQTTAITYQPNHLPKSIKYKQHSKTSKIPYKRQNKSSHR